MPYHPFRHLGLKVLAVALAALMWTAVSRDSLVGVSGPRRLPRTTDPKWTGLT